MVKYQYSYAPDTFDDDNNGLLYGVESDDGDYVEWFPTIAKLEANTKKYKFKVTNREQFLEYVKKMKKGD